MQNNIPTQHSVHVVGNIVTGGAIVASWTWLPPALAAVASLMAIGWYAVLFYDRFKKGRKS